jgi:hypothetical protein
MIYHLITMRAVQDVQEMNGYRNALACVYVNFLCSTREPLDEFDTVFV